MKYLITILLFAGMLLNAQVNLEELFKEKGEIYFRFSFATQEKVNELSRIISVDNIKDGNVYAYASEDEFQKFLNYGLPYEVLPHPGDVPSIEMSSNPNQILGVWDTYPTYDNYVTMMNQYAAQYPSICKLIDAGTTVQGRKILFLKISDNVNEREPEPRIMLSSTMHGDEATGFVLMLRLIDTLLTNYGENSRINNLIDNCEIWINPNANPDGTYRSGNNTVSGATRSNANNVDLNRNFPDPADGPHPDGKVWQPETIAMTNLAIPNRYTISMNIHGGAEVVNYPWDTWSRRHKDDTWFIFISRLYADTARFYSPSSYMSGFNNGITNGYDWYRVAGGRQDYFTYFGRSREVTLEISNTKLPSGSLLPSYWEYNRRSFFTYIENAMHGIRGIVTDTVGNPLKANIVIQGLDADNSDVYSDSLTGAYFRLIAAGTYTIVVTADSHYSKTISGVVVNNLQPTNLNIQLIPFNPVPVELLSFNGKFTDGKVILYWATATETNNRGFEIERRIDNGELINDNWETIGFVNGYGTTTLKNHYSFIDNNVASGKYNYRLKQIDYDGSFEYSNIIEIDLNVYIFTLEQNYPNPFNPNTLIKFNIANRNYSDEKIQVSLKVFDVLGNEVAVLVDEALSAGSYSVELNSKNFNLSSGVYIYRLTAGDFVDSKRMIFLK